MPRGRKPKPTVLKELAGNPGRRPLNENEPVPSGALPDPPAYLRSSEKRAWKIVSEEMKEVLTAADQFILESFCVAYAMKVGAARDIHKYGSLVPMPVQAGDKAQQLALNIAVDELGEKLPPAMRVQNPSVSIWKNAVTLEIKLAAELGLTPSARSRLKSELKEPDDVEDDLFGDVENKSVAAGETVQ